ncbi:hypothetical protein Nepgr_033994 [Nepenthes gracilis]|uniref:Uncharacterized protein n=1 Tax=Nepenthes gracilis TaxID=150966 RepID=A0AAD3TLF1_NEPGR|nr:hypothetical protein Nepgr_033994 [Nepenthes gracilis]
MNLSQRTRNKTNFQFKKPLSYGRYKESFTITAIHRMYQVTKKDLGDNQRSHPCHPIQDDRFIAQEYFQQQKLRNFSTMKLDINRFKDTTSDAASFQDRGPVRPGIIVPPAQPNPPPSMPKPCLLGNTRKDRQRAWTASHARTTGPQGSTMKPSNKTRLPHPNK